jgi:hypothetical protein
LNSQQQLILKRTLVATILVFMGLVLLQDLFPFKKFSPLVGVHEVPKDTTFSWENWKAGKYQSRRDAYLAQCFNLRNDFVRLHNSIQYYLLGKSEVKQVVLARQHHLMDKKQVESYLGLDALPAKEIERTAFYLKKVQDTLQTLDKKIFVVMVPEKPIIYPELIPRTFKKNPSPNNYEMWKARFDQEGVSYIDLVTYFQQLKNKGTKHLFPRRGSQWSTYGAALGLQYTIDHFNTVYNKNQLGKIHIQNEVYKRIDSTDLDLYLPLNLLQSAITDTLLYPQCTLHRKSTSPPRATFIADNSFIKWTDLGICNLFDSCIYLRQNREIISSTQKTQPSHFSPRELLEKNDWFIVVCATSNLDELGWNLIQQLYFHFYPQAPGRILYDRYYQKKIRITMEDIKREESWYNSIVEKAEKNNRLVDKQLYLDAVWIVEHQK